MDTKNIKVGINVVGKHRKRRATFAIRFLRKEIEKHLRTKDYALDNSVNSFVWKRGKAESPTQVDMTVLMEKVPRIFLANSPELKAYLEKGKEKKEAKEKKAEPKKEDKKEEAKKEEVKKEPAKVDAKPKVKAPKKETKKKE